MRHFGGLLLNAASLLLGSGRKPSRLSWQDTSTTVRRFSLPPSTPRDQTARPETMMTRIIGAAKKQISNEEESSRESIEEGETSHSKGSSPTPPPRRSKEEEDALLGYAIDSFLRGDYNLKLPDKTKPLPPPDLDPGSVVSMALRSLRGQDLPSQTHGAAVFMHFCLPLCQNERWGDASSVGRDPWKEVLRGGLTANTLVRRIRASDFAGLLDWNRLDVTEGAYTSDQNLVGLPSIAYVNAALFFKEDSEPPSLFQVRLRRVGGGGWMIDTIRRSQRELFQDAEGAVLSKE